MPTKTFEVIKDGNAPTAKTQVNRLTNMETEEVSLVDVAANKREFLVVKRDGGTEPTHTEPTEDTVPATTAKTKSKAPEAEAPEETTPEQEVTKTAGPVATQIDGALARIATTKAAVEGASLVEKAEGYPAALSLELRRAQYLLKSVAGTMGGTLVVPGPVDLAGLEITKAAQKDVLAALTEVERRLATLKAATVEATMLDTTQATTLDGAADLLVKGANAASGDLVILASSLTAEQREVALKAIEKSMDGLLGVYVGLHTNAVAKGTNVADATQVGVVLHALAGEVETACGDFLAGVAKRDLFATMVEEIRKVAFDAEAMEEVNKIAGLQAVGGVMSEIAKAASMYKVRTNWDLPRGDPNRYMVQLVTEPDPPKTEATFATETEAKLDSIKRNMALVQGIAKRIEVKPEGDTSEGAAQSTNDTQEGTVTTDTAKAGRPMQTDRLNRLKSAIGTLKEALADLRGGSVSMEKFKKAQSALGTILSELDLAKRGAAAQTGGVTDTRSASHEAPNAGSGVQPDEEATADVSAVAGEGTGELGAVLKRLEAMESKITQRDDEVRALRQENAKLRKRRSAPSHTPDDAGEIVSTRKGDRYDRFDESQVDWPMDMNNLSLDDEA